MISKVCPECNESFVPNRVDRKYCSEKCKSKPAVRARKAKHGYWPDSKKQYVKHKKTYCEKCGFVAEHRCQLDVDHIDGNHKNDDPSNLQTLCANCHRLKTYLNRDWEDKEP